VNISFEDLWPSTGDYDFNDLVVDYILKSSKQSRICEEYNCYFRA
jgi:LruC domain-containing protein